jgi:hypothetical protein
MPQFGFERVIAMLDLLKIMHIPDQLPVSFYKEKVFLNG